MADAVLMRGAPPILEVVLDRPPANAIDSTTSRLLGEVFSGFRDDLDYRVAIFTGAGDRFFSAGWDLNAAAAGEEYKTDYGVGGFGGFAELPDLHKPVIAAVNGMAVGGGFEMALSAHLIVAAEHAEFFMPETTMGIIGDVGTVMLPRMLPPAIARDILLTGKRLGVSEAVRWGLVNAAVPTASLMETAREMARTIAAAAPLAVSAVLATIARTSHLDAAAALAAMRAGDVPEYDRMLASEDAAEGPRAFADKRPPQWKGR